MMFSVTFLQSSQIDKYYTEALERDGIHKIMKYGIACNVKRCRTL